jgi:NitT/TauT family transport system substrate-binding protein
MTAQDTTTPVGAMARLDRTQPQPETSTPAAKPVRRLEPEVVRGFVKGMVKGLKFLYANPNEAAEIAKKQFPTMALEDLKATLDRSFSDQMWSKDGMISKEAWATGSAVVREAGILKTDVKYEEIIDMSFVESVRASL